ncbi:MAG: hypothetical protein M1827_006020 [Pycnora praestabilis]|nr:MAG: hypothetical protein M1827_006020 [Pycnora praestabilis]
MDKSHHLGFFEAMMQISSAIRSEIDPAVYTHSEKELRTRLKSSQGMHCKETGLPLSRWAEWRLRFTEELRCANVKSASVSWDETFGAWWGNRVSSEEPEVYTQLGEQVHELSQITRLMQTSSNEDIEMTESSSKSPGLVGSTRSLYEITYNCQL